jgi:hypothetical protein
MAEEKDYVDLTPKVGGMREYRLSPEDLVIIRDNPKGLTKEGCMVEILNWSQSNNQPVIMRYLAMYKQCQKWEKSGILEDGSVILARTTQTTRQGITKSWLWKEKIGQRDKKGDFIVFESVDKLREFVEAKLINLRFLTNKGA